MVLLLKMFNLNLIMNEQSHRSRVRDSLLSNWLVLLTNVNVKKNKITTKMWGTFYIKRD